jgi:hypothetical protein
MKKLYSMFCVCAALGFVSEVSAQVSAKTTKDAQTILMKNERAKTSSVSGSKSGADQVFFSEDFSNGFAGQGANGTWTTGDLQGNLWFHTFPLGMPNGYNPDAPLTGPAADVYGEFLPNFYGTGVIESETDDNGFMMLDADRWNSIATDPLQTGVAFLTSNEITSSLISPVIDLSAAEGQGVYLTFAQDFRFCCNDYGFNIDVSTDGGTTWLLIDYWITLDAAGNDNLVGTGSIDISELTVSSTDLSNFRFRFRWFDAGAVATAGSTPSHYYIMLDDINLISAPTNEIAIGRTFMNNYFDYPGIGEDTEYVKRFSYWNQPQYITRPFNFAAIATNNGVADQTNVQLEVVFTAPNMTTQTFLSPEGFTLPAGATDTLRILDVVPDLWDYPASEGTYSATFQIIQNEEDELPGNNIGTARTTRISLDEINPAFFQNDRNAISNLPLPADAQDVIHGNRFVFTEPEVANRVITHIEFVLLNSGTSITVPGEIIFLNVRTGSVYDPEDDNNVITRLFETEEIQFIIEPGSISAGGAPIWNSVELPTPILIEPDLIYQGEVEIPASDGPIAFVGLSNDNESGASVVANLEDMAWGSYTDIATMIRFRTQEVFTINTVSYESGIKLTQNYPNPFVDHTTIQYQLDETSNVRLEVYDINGKLMFADNLGLRVVGSANTYDFQRGNLAAGIYTYSLITDNDRVTRKMTIE